MSSKRVSFRWTARPVDLRIIGIRMWVHVSDFTCKGFSGDVRHITCVLDGLSRSRWYHWCKQRSSVQRVQYSWRGYRFDCCRHWCMCMLYLSALWSSSAVVQNVLWRPWNRALWNTEQQWSNCRHMTAISNLLGALVKNDWVHCKTAPVRPKASCNHYSRSSWLTQSNAADKKVTSSNSQVESNICYR